LPPRRRGRAHFQVEPLPLGHRRHGHVHRAEPDCHRYEEGRWGDSAAATRGVDRERREIAGDTGKQRDLCFGDGAPAGGPLAAEGKVVERDRLQVGSEYSPNRGRVPGVNLWQLNREGSLLDLASVLLVTSVLLVIAFVLLTISLMRLRRTTRQLQLALADESGARDRAALLLAIASAVNSSLALEEVLNVALTHAGRIMGAVAGAMYLVT